MAAMVKAILEQAVLDRVQLLGPLVRRPTPFMPVAEVARDLARRVALAVPVAEVLEMSIQALPGLLTPAEEEEALTTKGLPVAVALAS